MARPPRSPIPMHIKIFSLVGRQQDGTEEEEENQIMYANFRTVQVLNCKDSLHGVHVDTCFKAEDVPLSFKVRH